MFNGYQQYVVSIDNIELYFQQQALIGSFYFLVFQLLLIHNQMLSHPRSDYNYYFLYIHKPKDDQYANYTLFNLIIFNILFFLFIMVLLLKKKLIDLKVQKQIAISQPFVVRMIVSVGMIAQIDQVCFYNRFMTAKYMI